jgi:glycosyltransferase involved in cell wall biosynthesis
LTNPQLRHSLDLRERSWLESDMRVLAVDHTGGIDLFRGKWEWLSRRPDVELTVLAPETWIENFRLVRTDTRASGYRILTGKVGWRGYENRGFYYTGLARAIREVRPEILHLAEDQFSVFALQSVALQRVLAPAAKVLFYTLDNLHHGFRYPYRPSWAYGLIDRTVQRLSDCGVACSSDARDVLLSRGFAKPIRFIPLGLDPLHFRKQDAAGLRDRLDLRGFVVGYTGRLLAMKGLHVLAEALQGASFDWTWLVVGNGPERESLLARARAGGWEGRLRIVDTVPHAEVPAYLNLMDVVVLPSLTTSGVREQFGRVLTESMACEVPVIGSSSGSIPEVVGSAGMIVPEGDSKALAEALEKLAGDAALRTRLGAAGRARVLGHFTWEKAAAQYKTIYDGLMSGSLASERAPAWAQQSDACEDDLHSGGSAPPRRPEPGGG